MSSITQSSSSCRTITLRKSSPLPLDSHHLTLPGPRIAAEQALRQKVALKYDAPVARSALPPPVDPAALEFSLPGMSGPTSLESALQLGRSILAAGGTGGKGKGKAKATPSDAEAQEQTELGLKVRLPFY